MADPRTPALAFAAVHKGYAGRQVLIGAEGAIAPGEVVVLLGPSGSGKSTLVTLAAGMDLADAGRVLVAGQNLAALSERDRTLLRRRKIGLVFQGYNLIPELTVAENIGLRLALEGRADPARVESLLAEVGLTGRGGDHPDRLSGGEQQRVAVAAALVHDPVLVLADEPTGALDHASAARVVDLLVRLTRGRGGSLLFVTHNPDYQALADRTWRMEDGRLTTDPEKTPGAAG